MGIIIKNIIIIHPVHIFSGGLMLLQALLQRGITSLASVFQWNTNGQYGFFGVPK